MELVDRRVFVTERCVVLASVLAAGCPNEPDVLASAGSSATTEAETTPTTSLSGSSTSAGNDPTTETSGSSGTSVATETSSSTTDASSSTGFEPSTTTTTGNESSGADDLPCEQIMATLTPVAPNVMLVLDKSTYMEDDHAWDHDGDALTPAISRWNSLHQVVQAIVEAHDESVNFGAALYPSIEATDNYSIAACPVSMAVEVPVGVENGAALLAAIPPADTTDLSGALPSATVMTSVLGHLKSLDPAAPRAAIYMTSQAANCAADAVSDVERFEAYDESLHTIVADAFTIDGTPTYVLGFETPNEVTEILQDGVPDGINQFVKLNELAVQGGKPRSDPNEQFYRVTDQSELQSAVEAILFDAKSCVIPLESEPAFPEFTEVTIVGIEWPMVMDCASEDGWVYSKPAGPYDAIQLCGAGCAELKAAGEADVTYGCQ